MNSTMMTVPTRAEKRLHVFAFYTDFPAGVHAKWVADGLTRLVEAGNEPLLDIWKLDSIPSVGPLKQVILGEAQQADIWILACSSPCDHEAQILQWMNALTARTAGDIAPTLVIGLFDAPASSAANFTLFLELCSLFAQRAGRDFVWQRINRESIRDMSWLREAVEKLHLRQSDSYSFAPADF